MGNLAVSDVKPFVPAKNFQESLQFYSAMGWKINWQDDGLAELELGGHRIFLQNYYNKDWAENWMLFVTVEDARAWYEHALVVIEEGRYESAKINLPKKQDYGAIATHVIDPSGVLIHFAQFLDG